MEPYISVIVTAHDRRVYLPDALRSLEAQALPRDKFEVIVVKNFEDPASDEIIRRNGWKDVVTDVVPVGGKIAVGLEEAKGDVITFLEDDDMYRPERLKRILDYFSRHEGLAYFHNSQEPVGPEGRPLAFDSDEMQDIIVRSPERACRELFVSPGGFHNMSSIAVASWLSEDLRRSLRGVQASPDLAIMVRAVLAGKPMLLSGSRLTLWRVHTASQTPHAYGLREGDWRGAISGLAKAYLRWAREAGLMVKMLRGHPCMPYAEHLELVRRLEASAAPDWALGERPRSSPLDFARALYLRATGRMEGSAKLMLTLAMDSLVSHMPNPVREAWWRLRWSLG